MQHILRLIPISLLALFFASFATGAEGQEPAKTPNPPATETNGAHTRPLNRLAELRQQTLDRKQEAQQLRAALKNETDETLISELRRQLDDVLKSIDTLNATFEQVAINHLDLAELSERPEDEFDWQKDLLEIVQPLFSSLKEITDKPRKIEKLRSQILRHEGQLRLADQALGSIRGYQEGTPPPIVAEGLRTMGEKWAQSRRNIHSNLEAARFQLATLQGQETEYWEVAAEAVGAFLSGRGFTLLLAMVAVLLVWLIARAALRLFLHFLPALPNQKRQRRRQWLAWYGYRAVTTVLALSAVLGVFYARSDVLLLALTLIGLVMIGAALRQMLPKYIKEIRILLDFGSVREGERLVYSGIPMEIKTIHAFAILRNPELEGIVRLPLETLVDLISRPCGPEPWFPTRVGEFLLLPDGRYAEVVRQTIETVQLQILGSLVNMPSTEFVRLDVTNLSRVGFAVLATFGIDYRHQPICLDRVPALMRESILAAIQASPFSPHYEDLVVDFKTAGASSLDYMVLLKMNGAAAASYFAIRRLIQQALVALCNDEGWVIPFTQVTLHQGEGFGALACTTTIGDGVFHPLQTPAQ